MHNFGALYSAAWKRVFFAKIGLESGTDDDIALVQDLLARMADNQADFTLTFRALAIDRDAARELFVDPTSFDDWAKTWQARGPTADMTRANPGFIPRNHRIEQAITAAVNGDDAPFHRLNTVLSTPFDDQSDALDLQEPPKQEEVVQATFCGT